MRGLLKLICGGPGANPLLRSREAGRLRVGRGGIAIWGNPTARMKKARADGEHRPQVLVVNREASLLSSSGTSFGAQGSTSWLCTMRLLHWILRYRGRAWNDVERE